MVEKLDINKIIEELGGHGSKNILHTHGIRVAVITCDTFVDFYDINDKSDELLYLLKGNIKLETERGPIYAKEGELIVIPKGLRHGPVHGEKAVMLEIERR
ncbi:MAG: homogentisate 1,2-dioxygenase [Candidatus Brocadiales bacterium]